MVVTTAVAYKGKNGVQRTSSFQGTGGAGTLMVNGTYSGIQITVTATYYGCDLSRSDYCSAAATASPK